MRSEGSVLGLCVCLSVCVSVTTFSATVCNKAASLVFKNGDFCKNTAFKSYAVKTKWTSQYANKFELTATAFTHFRDQQSTATTGEPNVASEADYRGRQPGTGQFRQWHTVIDTHMRNLREHCGLCLWDLSVRRLHVGFSSTHRMTCILPALLF